MENKDKILTKDPFKIKNKMVKEKEVIQKILDTITKKDIPTETGDCINTELQKLLLKTKDPVQAWVRANVLDELGYFDIAILFKDKAQELGYIIENKKINENMDEVKTFKCNVSFEVQSTIGNEESTKDYVKDLLDIDNIGRPLDNLEITVEEITNKYPLSDQGNKLYNSAETEENIQESSTSDEYKYFKIIGIDNSVKYIKILTDETDITKIMDDKHVKSVDTITKEEFYNEMDLVKKIMKKYSNLSPILQKALTEVLKDINNDKDEVIKAISVITSDNKEKIKKMFDEFTTNENHKQQFEYSPQEETKWNIFEDDDSSIIEKPIFNDVALRHLISDDAFLKFSYHNLATGDETKDLEMIYNTYIKNDEDMLTKLKTYESYRISVLETNCYRDTISSTILESINKSKITTEISMTYAIDKFSKIIKENMANVIDTVSLYTPDVKKELKLAFQSSSVEDTITKFKTSDITLSDIKKNVVAKKIADVFDLSESASKYITNILNRFVSTINEVRYVGNLQTSHLFATSATILLFKGLDISLTK